MQPNPSLELPANSKDQPERVASGRRAELPPRWRSALLAAAQLRAVGQQEVEAGMGDYFVGALGIAVSVGLFLVGYRQTVGARKERVNAANSEVEKILVRRIVLESYKPVIQDVIRLVEGKARDFRVRRGDLLSEAEALNSVFTRIMESDLIARDQREEILGRIVPVITDAETEPLTEADVAELPPRRRLLARNVGLLALGILASLAGTLATILPTLPSEQVNSAMELLMQALPLIVASLVMIATVFAAIRFRESQERVETRSEGIGRAIDFERQVAREISKGARRAVVKFASSQDRGFDFAIDDEAGRILVEVKAWSRPVPLRVLKEISERLGQALDEHNAARAFIVTPQKVTVPQDSLGDPRVRIVTISELRNFLTHAKS